MDNSNNINNKKLLDSNFDNPTLVDVAFKDELEMAMKEYLKKISEIKEKMPLKVTR